MADTPIRIWTRAAHHPAFKCGGWAYVRVDGAERSGQAGGERNTRAERMALAGLAAALKDLPKSAAPIRVDLGSGELVRLARRIVGGPALGPDEAPTEDLDLWAQLATALKDRTASFELGDASFKGGPAPFAQAWADLASDKAKAGGAFTAAIPKPNLAKINLG
jgi:hypothetical protein